MAKIGVTFQVPEAFIQKIAEDQGWSPGDGNAAGLALFKTRTIFIMKREGRRIDHSEYIGAFAPGDPDITSN